MKNHLRATIWLLVLTVGVVCVVYPAVMWMFAQLFPESASGSLITQKAGDKEIVKGSQLIAQPFGKDWYFQPRPSAVSWNATASGASNWSANNPKLRDRVARQLGPIVKYNPDGPKKDESVKKDIETWFVNYQPETDRPPLIVAWATDYPSLAAAWLKNDANKAAAIEWLRGHPQILENKAPDVDLNNADSVPFDDIASKFFESVAATEAFKNHWPEPEDFETGEKNDKGEPVKSKRFKPVKEGTDLQSTFFDLWLQAHADADLVKVPADMVMASGSGLDPHITLRNANYQLEGVVVKRAEAAHRDVADVRSKVRDILKEQSFTPLSGLIGEPLVNVLEVNMEMDKEFPIVAEPAKSQ